MPGMSESKKIKIKKFPQSCFVIEIKGRAILIDPGIYCAERNFGAENFRSIDILLVTHVHPDHCDKNLINEIKKSNKSMLFFSNHEVKEEFEKYGIECEILNYGERINISGIEIMSIESEHGKPVAGEKPELCSFLIDNKIYHAGDSVYNEDIAHFLKSLKSKKVLLLPVSGYVAMDYREACRFAKKVDAELVIPMHYDSPRFNVNVNDFLKEAKRLGLNAKIIENGKSIEIEI